MKIAECPICESKFDISVVPEGTKLRCGQCKRVFAVVKEGEAVPFFEEVTLSPIGAPAYKAEEPVSSEPEPEAEPEYEKVVVRRRRVSQAEAVEEGEKPEPLLLIAGLVGLACIITLIYTFTEISRPVELMYKKEMQKAPAEEKSEKKSGLLPVLVYDREKC